MKDKFTNKELGHLDELNNDLIVSLYYTKEEHKGHILLDFLKKAYLAGREQNTEFFNTPTIDGEQINKTGGKTMGKRNKMMKNKNQSLDCVIPVWVSTLNEFGAKVLLQSLLLEPNKRESIIRAAKEVYEAKRNEVY